MKMEYDHDNGAFVEEGATWLHMKYPEQGRLCMGMAATMTNDGAE